MFLFFFSFFLSAFHAYRVGKGWNFNPQKLDELLAKQPNILYKCNK